jgi:hypothetical protein
MRLLGKIRMIQMNMQMMRIMRIRDINLLMKYESKDMRINTDKSESVILLSQLSRDLYN